jgi:hypothetical protein
MCQQQAQSSVPQELALTPEHRVRLDQWSWLARLALHRQVPSPRASFPERWSSASSPVPSWQVRWPLARLSPARSPPERQQVEIEFGQTR